MKFCFLRLSGNGCGRIEALFKVIKIQTLIMGYNRKYLCMKGMLNSVSAVLTINVNCAGVFASQLSMAGMKCSSLFVGSMVLFVCLLPFYPALLRLHGRRMKVVP